MEAHGANRLDTMKNSGFDYAWLPTLCNYLLIGLAAGIGDNVANTALCDVDQAPYAFFGRMI
ncbi:hypothetical protein ATE67_14250 [Sphingopyxis sp. H050]|nr:hypothetical protein ATE67_14250 [Sphingopyxis sp. H050]